MYKIKVTVEGTGKGLLMHKFGIEATASVEREVKKAKPARPGPAEEAEQGAYRIETTDGNKGQLCLPAEHFLGAMIKAGSSQQVKGKGKKTYKASMQGNVEIQPEYIGLTDDTSTPLSEYIVDSRPVRIKATGGRVIRHRPHLKAWRAMFEIVVMDDGVPLEVVQAILAEAGQSSCVGDYRPRFGQFRIVSFDKES